jgi:predicted RNA-binding Zn-ribbon protein involved in translation (DUF1610 family)
MLWISSGTLIDIYLVGELDMKITCPLCRAILEIKKDDVLGKYYVCPNCHWAFQWEPHLLFAKSPHKQPKRKPET